MAGFNATVPSEKVLLVEGQDDKHVVGHIRLRHAPMPEFDILDKDNVDKLIASIPLEIKVSGRKVVGIVLDANDDLASRWDAVANKLTRANIEPPRALNKKGTIIPGTPQVGIWVMPDNQSPGELEDFAVNMISPGDPIWPLSCEYIEKIPVENRKFVSKKNSRAKLYAWLATRETPNLIGTAIRARDLDVDGELCKDFVEWIRQLFR